MDDLIGKAKDHVVYIAILLILSAFIRIGYHAVRPPLTHDEAISYLAAAGKQDDFQKLVVEKNKFCGKFVPVSTFKNFMTPNSPLNFSEVNLSMSHYDVHPPLYYWFLRVWVFFTGVRLRLNLLLNVFFSLITAILIYFYAFYLTKSKELSFLSALIFSVGPSVTHVTGILRHYELLGTIAVASVFFTDYLTKEKIENIYYWIFLAFIIAFGLTTHIFFMFILLPILFLASLRLSFNKKKSIRYLFLAIALGVIVTLVIFPEYPYLFKDNFKTAVEKQKFINADIDKKLRNASVLIFGNFYPIINRFFQNRISETIGTFNFYLFVVIICFLAVLCLYKKQHITNYFPVFVFLVSFVGQIIAIRLRLIPAWSTETRYLAHLYPLVPILLLTVLPKERQKNLAILALFAYSLYLLAGNYWVISSLKEKNRNVYKYKTFEKVVVNKTSRGYFFLLIYYLPETATVYLDSYENLMRFSSNWISLLEKGDVIISIVTTSEDRDKERELLRILSKNSKVRLTFRGGYYGNIHPYMVR